MVLLQSEKMPIGWQAADFSLPATTGKTYSLADFSRARGVLIIFSCNHCPYAKAAWPILISLSKQYPDLAFAAINPNDEVSYPEDSFAVMKEKVVEWGIPFPYLRDESQEVARAYKAQCTPDPYLFRSDAGALTLFYHGRVNDNWQDPEAVTERNLEDAIAALLSGGTPAENQPPSMGCSIKWKE